MPDFTDPFDRIVASSGMGEWPDPGFETIPPYKVALLQEALIDHMVAADAHLMLEEPELTVLLARLQRLYEQDFDRLGIFKPGDVVKFSRSGLVMSIAQSGDFGVGLIEDDMYIKGVVGRPVIMEAPLIESIRVTEDDEEPADNPTVAQLAACIQLTDVVVSEDGTEEESLDGVEGFTCVPLIYDLMKIQRKL
jgi:hypothetical protein